MPKQTLEERYATAKKHYQELGEQLRLKNAKKKEPKPKRKKGPKSEDVPGGFLIY